MATSPDVRRANFAGWVRRTLTLARQRGMNDAAITAATGISGATFHRWQRGDGGLPRVEKVEQFALGLDMPLQPALTALGLGGPRRATPPPPMDPDVELILRYLANPRVSEAEKSAMRNMLQLLSRQAADPNRATG